MQNKWRVSGSIYKMSETSTEIDGLPVAIYKLEMTIFGPQLNRLEDSFEIPKKIYGSDKKMVDRIVKTYHNTDGNLGVLLNGLKGTGKSLASKMLCNELGLPVILIDNPYGGGAADFISELPDDVTLFFDEYEKNFTRSKGGDEKKDNSILSVMDGAMTNGSRKVFLLTSNNPYVDDNMIERPGRIRYFKNYTHLTKDVIMEVVDDKLENKELRDVTIKFISKLRTISMDIVNAVVEEVNIHNEDPEEFKEIFNVEEIDDVYNVYEILDGGDRKIVKLKCKINPYTIDSEATGMDFYVGSSSLGDIVEAIPGIGFKANTRVMGKKGWEYEVKTYLIEKTYATHYSFNEMAF